MRLDLRKVGVLGAIAILALALGFAPGLCAGHADGNHFRHRGQRGRRALAGRHRHAELGRVPGRARQDVTDASGAFTLPWPAAGRLQPSRSRWPDSPRERNLTVALGGHADVKATMSVASIQETLEVVGREASILNETQVATNLKYEETVDKLAMNRTLAGIAALAPGLTNNTPNAGQVTIARRLRLRQRVPAQRRGHQRQPVRQRQQPLHRGRDRGDAGPDLRHLRGVRPLLGRRRQRRHQARRQHVLRAASGPTSPTRTGSDETPFEKTR